jgi:K(+)-stimulated pyrophosphate-energized sodium pump
MAVAAGAWDNVRRLIETGAHGGPASRAHRAAVAADTLGERWREAVTPALMGLVVFAATVALAFAPLVD